MQRAVGFWLYSVSLVVVAICGDAFPPRLRPTSRSLGPETAATNRAQELPLICDPCSLSAQME